MRTNHFLSLALMVSGLASADGAPRQVVAPDAVGGAFVPSHVAHVLAPSPAEPMRLGPTAWIVSASPTVVPTLTVDADLYRPVPAVLSFAINSDELDDTTPLDSVLARAAYPGVTIRVTGYADPTGPTRRRAEYNLQLSARRAQAVADWLVSQGVDQARISIMALGDSVPPGGTSSGRVVEVVASRVFEGESIK